MSLDGTVIAKNGNMTGGVSSADKEGAAAGRWDERELRAAQARRDLLLQVRALALQVDVSPVPDFNTAPGTR